MVIQRNLLLWPNDGLDAIRETTPQTLPDVEIQDIEGIGPTTAKNVKEAGIVSVMDLAVTSADELDVDININEKGADDFEEEGTSKKSMARDLAKQHTRQMIRQ